MLKRSWFWRHMVIPWGDRLAGQTVARHLRFFERSQYWPREKILAQRDELVRSVFKTAFAQCSFYRELYEAHGVGLEDVKCYSDLSKLPLVTKEMLRKAYPAGVVLPTRHRAREYSTSGSTGEPFTLLIDDDTMSQARALMFLRTLYAGWDFDRPLFQTGMAIKRGFLKRTKDWLFRIHYNSAFDLSNNVLDGYLETIDRHKLRYLAGYAQSINLLAERALEVGFSHECEAAITWGSNLHSHFRDTIRKAFGCESFDSYGVGEGMQIAAQSVHSGRLLHQFCLHVAVEIVEGNKPVPDGSPGEIILTRLNAGAMPLIRYSVGDSGRMHAGDGSPGGINLPLLESIDGRVSDIVITPNGNKLIAEFFFGIFQYAPSIKLFQIEQTELGVLNVKIVPGANFEYKHWQLVEQEILIKGDPDLTINVDRVAQIPLEKSGKRRFIISRINTAAN